MRIITVSRQFGSGGRELGKRLAEILGWDYYDKGILQQLADESGFNPEYVNRLISSHEWRNIPLSYSNTFSSIITFEPGMKTSLLIRQREIIEDIAKAGNDFIIVGRDADVILRDYGPFRIFVCADMENRVDRCMKHENKKEEKERLSEKEVIRNIKSIDSNRAQSRELVTGRSWSDSTCYDLTVNTGGRDIRRLAQAVGDYALRWFGQ